nr:YARHG domain-containing protein [Aureibaculum flavum]
MNPSEIKKTINPKKIDYEGSYHFGESEGESDLEIIFSNNKLYARTEYADWENNTWVGKSDRLPIEYSKHKTVIDKTEYELSISDNEKGLISHYYKNVGEKTHHYIQFNPSNDIEKPQGKYPESSFVKLTLKELTELPKSELKIMRNEIFARNGYIFKSGGKMDTYFSKKIWYKPIKKDNINFSDIEKHNIELILKLE